jgi:bacterioferritin
MNHAAPKKQIFNLDDIKSQAIQSINDGSVTLDYPVNIMEACSLLNDALADRMVW